jgi:hypothetical protein
VSDNNNNNKFSDSKITRRDFLKAMFWGGTGLALGGMGLFNMKNNNNNKRFAFADGGGGGGSEVRGTSVRLPMSESERKAKGLEIRKEAAERTYDIEWPEHINNGEEKDYPYIANYSKTLGHNKLGEVGEESYISLLRAAESGKFEDWDNVILGTTDPPFLRCFNPVAGLTFTLEGPDPFALFMPPAPRIDSPEGAADIAEVYWMALARDVYLNGDFDSNKTIARAAEDLSSFPGYFGPTRNGKVTPDNIFTIDFPGVAMGPYVSQFALQGSPIPPFGLTQKDGHIITGWANTIDQRILTSLPGSDYLTDFNEWLRVENGHDPREGMFCSIDWDPTPRFMRYPRDLANWVHYDDVPSQEFTFACLLLLHQEVPCMMVSPDPAAALFGGSAPFDPGNPYRQSQFEARRQEAFFSFGPFHPLAFATEVALHALRAVWFQKYYVHRRLRPEEFGARIHIQKTGQEEYPIHRDLFESDVFNQPEFKKRNSFMLPQVFPEGCPPHPSYGAGHATVVGAQATVLKAFFDETYVLPKTYVASRDGKELEPYTGPDKDNLTVGGELNKLASNVALGRNFAGVHYRSDAEQSMLLGEKIAIEVIQQRKEIWRESGAFNFTKFNGEKVRISF